MSAPEWQRWTITIPAGQYRTPGNFMIATAEMAFDAYIPNLYNDEAMMRALLERAEVVAYMEYADPPARRWDRERALDECQDQLEAR